MIIIINDKVRILTPNSCTADQTVIKNSVLYGMEGTGLTEIRKDICNTWEEDMLQIIS
jgi:hypothetical protein